MTEMTKVETDEYGRITLPQEVRQRYGEEYRLVELQSSLQLVPVPADPVESLQSAGSEELDSLSAEGLREVALEIAREEVTSDADDE